jgi:transposase
MSNVGRQGADGGERRRRAWSGDQKRRILAESFAPGASVAEVARRYGLNANMLFTWRQRERAAGGVSDVGESVNIVPVKVMEAMPTVTVPAADAMGRMEIVLIGGERIIVGPDVEVVALSRVLKALTRR